MQAEQLDMLTDDGQPEPEAELPIATRVGQLVERLEHPLSFSLRDPAARVCHPNADAVTAPLDAQDHMPLLGVADRVVQEVAEDAIQQDRGLAGILEISSKKSPK